MNRLERMDYLIGRLLESSSRRQPVGIPQDEAGKWRLLRSLMNVRRPGPVEAAFLREQDALLRELTAEKGVVDVEGLPALPGMPNLILWQGDITRLRVGAIVNAANSAMLGCFQPGHSCIDNIIHTYAGVQLREECDRLMRRQGREEPTGAAKLTGAYNLPCAHVLHTVGPIISDTAVTEEHDRLLASCYRSCLELADEHKLASIAFCCISTGVFRFPRERAARIAIQTVRNHPAVSSQKMKVVFNVYTEEDRAIYERLLGTD